MFAPSNRKYHPYDHGGPLAYCFYGMLIRPHHANYLNRLVMQISGGPTMGDRLQSEAFDTASKHSADVLDGTALDAFWPTHRPLISAR